MGLFVRETSDAKAVEAMHVAIAAKLLTIIFVFCANGVPESMRDGEKELDCSVHVLSTLLWLILLEPRYPAPDLFYFLPRPLHKPQKTKER